jgi:hypothetical protein
MLYSPILRHLLFTKYARAVHLTQITGVSVTENVTRVKACAGIVYLLFFATIASATLRGTSA